MRNVLVKTLAQGDNQVVCTQYELSSIRNDQQMRETLDNLIFQR